MSPAPVPAESIAHVDFPLNADGLVVVSMRSVASVRPSPTALAQKLTQAKLSEVSDFQLLLVSDDLPGPRPASVQIEHPHGTKGWMGEVAPVSATGPAKGVATTFKSGGSAKLSLDLFKERIFGKGAFKVSLTTTDAVPPQVKLPDGAITYENVFDVVVKVGGGSAMRIGMQDALGRGALLPGQILVGAAIELVSIILPPALAAQPASDPVEVGVYGKGEDGEVLLLGWFPAVASGRESVVSWRHGLTLDNRLDPGLATKNEYLNVQIAFRVGGKKPRELLRIPLAETLPKPCLQSVSLVAAKRSRGEYGRDPRVAVASTTAVAPRHVSALKMEGLYDAAPPTDANWIEQVDATIVVTDLHPGAVLALEGFVGFTPTAAAESKSTPGHMVARLFGCPVPSSPYHPRALTLKGSAAGFRNEIPVVGMVTEEAFAKKGITIDGGERFQDIFLVLACMRTAVKGGTKVVPMRQLLRVWFTDDDGASVDFTKDFREVVSVAKPAALGTGGLDPSGKRTRVFKSLTVKYDDRLADRVVTLVPGPGGLLLADVGFSLKEAVARHMSSYKSLVEVDRKWVAAGADVIQNYLDPDSTDNTKWQGQFIPLDKYMDLPADKVRSFMASMERTYPGIGIVGERSPHVLTTAKKHDMNPAYCLCHLMIEWCFLSKGFESGGKTYYNFFGIGAKDSDPAKGGKAYAVDHGWDSIEKALSDGLEYVRNDWLVVRKRRTLYDMRWNMAAMQKEVYATGVSWACDVGMRMSQILTHCGITQVPTLIKPRFRA